MSALSEPLEFTTVNAEAIDDYDLERLYVPNSINGNPTFYRVAHPLKTYLLVADRGMGKTHILKLIRKKLNDRNNIVVDISSYSSAVEHTYYQLKETYSNVRFAQLWELAILEIGCVKLLGAGFYPYKLNKITPLLFTYFAKYQPTELDYSKLFWEKQFKANPERGPLAEITFSIKTFWGEFSTGVKRNTAYIETPPPVSFNDRYKLLSDWFWQTLRTLQSQNNFKFKNQTKEGFPSVRSLYVIADGLDQEQDEKNRKTVFPRPIAEEDLNGLIGALKMFDTLATENLKGAERNFKMVLALRAITFTTSVKHKDLTQMRGNIEHLKWDDDSLKSMMAQFIKQFSKQKIESKKEHVLNRVFPENIYYFGKKFDTGADFIIEYTEKRPREILLLWKDCTIAAGNEDDIYTTPLESQHLVDGLKKYSTKALPDDISNEYELEFPGIEKLIASIADNYTAIPRVVAKEQLEKIILNYVYKTDPAKRPPWLIPDKNHVIKILFQTGIVGIPDGDFIDENWPKANFSKEKTSYGIESASNLVIRPAFWNHLTNIEVETKNRRIYIRSLYTELQKYAMRAADMFALAKNDPRNFEMILGRFFALCDMVDNFNKYPEPADWNIWTVVDEKIRFIYSKFITTPLCSNRTELSRLIEFYKKVVLQKNIPTTVNDETLFVDFHVFSENIQRDSDYQLALRSIHSWLNEKEKPKEAELIKEFRLSLIKEEDSLHSILGEAKDKVTALL